MRGMMRILREFQDVLPQLSKSFSRKLALQEELAAGQSQQSQINYCVNRNCELVGGAQNIIKLYHRSGF